MFRCQVKMIMKFYFIWFSCEMVLIDYIKNLNISKKNFQTKYRWWSKSKSKIKINDTISNDFLINLCNFNTIIKETKYYKTIYITKDCYNLDWFFCSDLTYLS